MPAENRCDWRNVEEERPPKDTTVICCGPCGGMFVGRYRGGYEEDPDGSFYCRAYVDFGTPARRFRYWMFFPEIPEAARAAREEDLKRSRTARRPYHPLKLIEYVPETET